MFNMAKVRGDRLAGSNPTRPIPKCLQKGSTQVITSAELKRLFAYLDWLDAEGLGRAIHG